MEQNRTLQLRQRSGSGTGLEEARTHRGQQLAPDLEPHTRPQHTQRVPPLGTYATSGVQSHPPGPCVGPQTPPPVQWGGEKPAMAAPPSCLSQIGRS